MGSSAERRSAQRRSSPEAALRREVEVFANALSRAVADDLGLPELARVASRALGASVALVDASGKLLALAGTSRADERQLTAGEDIESVALQAGGRKVGELRLRLSSGQPAKHLIGVLTAVISLEVDRHQGPLKARAKLAKRLVTSLMASNAAAEGEMQEILAGLDLDVAAGVTALAVTGQPRAPQPRDWSRRLAVEVERLVRPSASGAIVGEHGSSAYVLLAGPAFDQVEKLAQVLTDGLTDAMPGIVIAVGYSSAADALAELATTLHQAHIAASVARAKGIAHCAYADSGSYRLLLAMLATQPEELQRFYEQTVGPIVEYERQYQTGLVATLETFVRMDSKFEATAQALYAHRHTVRYRLERIRDLTGFDVNTSEGREMLGLGLKAMHVLGIEVPAATAASQEDPEAESK